MKYLQILFTVVICFVCCSCGHTIFTETKLIGVDATFPLPDGQRIGARIGDLEQTTATVRGNTSFTTHNVTGGGIFSGSAGTGRYSALSAGPQLNEGYVTEVMTSPNVPESVKLAIAEKYLTVGAPVSNAAQSKTLGVAVGSGDNPPNVDPATTGY